MLGVLPHELRRGGGPGRKESSPNDVLKGRIERRTASVSRASFAWWGFDHGGRPWTESAHAIEAAAMCEGCVLLEGLGFRL